MGYGVWGMRWAGTLGKIRNKNLLKGSYKKCSPCKGDII